MEHEVRRIWMTKLDADLITPLPAFDPGSIAAWGSKRIKLWPQSCLCLTWYGYPSNDDDSVNFYIIIIKLFLHDVNCYDVCLVAFIEA